MREHMRLTLSPEKTSVTHVDDGFDLLGFRIRRRPWRANNRHVAYTFPSQRALRSVMHRIKTLTQRNTTYLSLDELIYALNPILRGWANYFRHAASKRCFAYLSYYLWWRVMRWLRKKYPRLTGNRSGASTGGPSGPAPMARDAPGPPRSRSPDIAIEDTASPRRGRPPEQARRPPGRRPPLHRTPSRSATACPVESRMLGNGHVRYGGRVGETDRRQRRHRAPARPDVSGLPKPRA